MTYEQLMGLHLITVLPCALLGAALLLAPKGTTGHRHLGRVFLGLMLVTATLTLWMPARAGPVWRSHFGYLHALSVVTIATVFYSYAAIRRGKVLAHQASMVCLYIGAILVAGGFTLMPGRFLHRVLFGD